MSVNGKGRFAVCTFALALLAGCANSGEAGDARYGFGRSVDSAEIARWDIDIKPSGEGLPAGRGTVSAGGALYQQLCTACHGDEGQGGTNDRLVAAYVPGVNYSEGTTPRTIGNYWPYATTLFDYIRRAMPHNAPGSLTNQQVYDLSAWLLFRNGLIAEQDVIDSTTLPGINMPAHELFYWSEEVSQ